jgi:hypothetical protein
MWFTFAAAVLGALALGFLAGLLIFKIKSQWCGVCGNTLACPQCAMRTASSPIRVRVRSQT